MARGLRTTGESGPGVRTMKRIVPIRKWLGVLFLGMLLLVGCGIGQSPESESAEPAEPAEASDVADVSFQPALGRVIAEANIEPARWTELRFEVGGTVEQVLVEPGDQVGAGDPLVRLDPTDAVLAVQRAEQALASAQAQLALLRVLPRAEDVAAAKADVEAAQAAVSRAVAQRDQVTGGAIDADIAAAEAELAAAEAQWLQTREEHRDIHESAKEDEDKVVADYQLHAAREAVAAAQIKLDVQQAIADERAREAGSGVGAALAQQAVSEAQLDLAKVGSAPWEIAAAEAAVAQAEAALAEAEIALGRTVIFAPFAGTVTQVHTEVGNAVGTGEPLVVLAALNQLEARTIDLTELDVVRVAPGQSVVVSVDALPDQPLDGHVVRIGLRDVDYRGDVTYPVFVALDEVVPELRWGMTAVVEIDAD